MTFLLTRKVTFSNHFFPQFQLKVSVFIVFVTLLVLNVPQLVEGITVMSCDRKGLCDQQYRKTLFGISVVDFVCGFSKLVFLYVLLDTRS